MRVVNLTGQRFHYLTVLYRTVNTKNQKAQWFCICNCGNTTVVRSANLRNGGATSCGCYRVESATKSHLTHGHTGKAHKNRSSPEYGSWASMMSRCYRPQDIGYSRYGGRGISVCPRWHVFTNFLTDMGLKPSPEWSIDRLDNDKNYEPNNCRWATRSEQAANRRPFQWKNQYTVNKPIESPKP